jgi:hypothetical protein
VYLFDTGDWDSAREYVADDTIVFVNIDISTLPADEVRQLLATRRVVFMVMIDTQPYYPLPAPAFYNVFYTVEKPGTCSKLYYDTTDPCFKSVLGETIPVLYDYQVSRNQKVADAVWWAGVPEYMCNYSYKLYNAGAIVEVPFDGTWKSADWLGKYVDVVRKCVLPSLQPRSIIWLAYQGSGIPEWHECNPVEECWRQLCEARGWLLLDLRNR